MSTAASFGRATVARPVFFCGCQAVPMGSHSYTVEMRTPWGQQVCIDVCLATTMAYLWHEGVETLNSCCGHNTGPEPSVIVSPQSIQTMLDLGFQAGGDSVIPDQTFVIPASADAPTVRTAQDGRQ